MRKKTIYLVILTTIGLMFFSSFTHAQNGSIALSVTETEVAATDKNILGEAFTSDSLNVINDPLWRESYKNLVKPISPGIIRFPHFRSYWERTTNSNYWGVFLPENGIFNDITADRRLHFIPRGWVTQKIYPGRFTIGKRYRLSFDYEGKGISLPDGVWDFRGVYLDLYHYEGEPWWVTGNGKNLAWFDYPNGDNSGHKVLEFVYSGISGKVPMMVLLTLHLGDKVSGEAWLDNFQLECLDCASPSGNLIHDGDFSVFNLPPNDSYFSFVKRISAKDTDQLVAFIKDVSGEPLYQWGGYFEAFNILKYYPNLDPDNSAELENAVLNFPGMETAISTELDILKYVNIDKKYQVKYWEFGNEPEIWWTYLDSVLAAKYPNMGKTFNYGTSPVKVYARYKLYGLLYAKIAGKAKRIDPTIKLGVALVPRQFWKESIDGFFEGLRLGRERFDATAPNPDFFAPHPYQLASWGANPKCPDDPTACIDNLLTFKDANGGASCLLPSCTIDKMTANVDYISFFEPYIKCITNYLKQKGITDPMIIPTEWEASGSTGMPYGRFGDEVWAADRLGKSIRAGIFGQNHWYLGIEGGIINQLGKIGSPYVSKAFYAKIMQNPTKLLTGNSSNEEQVSVYPFRENPESPLYLVMVNLKKENGTLPATVNLPAIYKNKTFTLDKVGCDDDSPNPDPARGCLYERNVTKLNGVLTNSQNILELLGNPSSQREILSDTASYSFDFPNHSVMFWKIGDDYQYKKGWNKINFTNFSPDKISAGCEKYTEKNTLWRSRAINFSSSLTLSSSNPSLYLSCN